LTPVYYTDSMRATRTTAPVHGLPATVWPTFVGWFSRPARAPTPSHRSHLRLLWLAAPALVADQQTQLEPGPDVASGAGRPHGA
jgi:hypothetical protein